jgi:dipeptidyl aminopeptidase/acylaminoacyl peptidase
MDYKWLRVPLVAGAISCVSALSAQTLQTKFPDNEQLRHYRSISAARLSPDGKSILFSITDSTADDGKSHLWLTQIEGGEPRQLTFSPENDRQGERNGEWMPDGKSILFTAHRGEHTSLYRLPMDGGEAKAFELKALPAADNSRRADAIPSIKPEDAGKSTESKPEPLPIDVNSYRISPDGKTIAITAHDPQTAGEKKERDAKADANWVNHDPHGTRLYLLDAATAKLTTTGVAPDVRGVSWSPDSTALMILADAPGDEGDLKPSITTWQLSLPDPNHPVQLTDLPPTIHTVVWSADRQRLLFLGQAKQDAPPGFSDLYEYTIATRATRDLTEDFAGSVGRGETLALRSGEVLQLGTNGFDTELLRFAPGALMPTKIKLPIPTVNLASTNQDETGWVFIGAGGGHGPAMYYASSLTGETRLVNTPKLVPEGVKIASAPKRLKWTNEKLPIEGLLYLPPEAEHAKVPLIVEVHGGPLGAYTDNFSPFIEFMLGHGWALLETNPRGSTGYGVKFAAANHNDLGGADYRDIMAGVDYILKTEPIDAGRMGLMGYSYGGEMAAFVEGKTTRFKAIISGAPVIDQQSEYGTEGGSSYDRWYYGKPWEHPEDAWRQSPLSGAAHAKTPFMLLQGEADTTDPLGQAQEMYRALRQENVPVELVTYPRENHGPLSMGIYGSPTTEPWHGFDARQRIVSFFTRYFDAVSARQP